MSKITIIDGNSNDKDNIRAIMVKGEKGDKGDTGDPTKLSQLENDVGFITSEEANLQNYYNKSEIDATVEEINATIDEKADTTEIETEITAINNTLNSKANTTDVATAYATKTEMNDLISHETSIRTNVDNTLQDEINSLASGSPLVASSTSGMTDTTRVYVNTTDGKWYYHNGSAWTQGGTYQASESSDDVNKLLDYKKELEKIIDNKSNLISSVIPGTYYTGTTGNSIVVHSNSGYNATIIRIPKSRKITSNANISNNFSFVTDASGEVINTLSSYQTSVDWVYQGFPNNAEFLYISRSGSLDNVVILDGNTTIKNIVTIDDYPQNTITKAIIPKLYSNVFNDYIDNILHTKTTYETLYNTLPNFVTEFSTFNTATTKINANTFEITGNNGGAKTNDIELNRYMRVAGKVTYNFTAGEVLFGYYSDNWHYTDNKTISSNTNFEFVFDANYYKIYQSATKFRILIRPKNNALGVLTINSLEVNEISDFELNELYDYNFKEMMNNVFNHISGGGAQVSDNKFLTSPNGDNFILNVNNNGVLSAINTTPNKVLFMGNSLLLGMNSSSSNKNYIYGMCASSPSKDYFYYVKQAILDKNNNCEFSKVHGAQFEQLATGSSFATLWNTTPNYYTGEPLSASFTSDLDLIIIQISDNINTEDRRNAFTQNADTFMNYVRTASPNARIIWVDGWFGYSNTHSLIMNVCKKWNIENIAINDLHTTNNEGYSGQTYINGNGETATVSDNWITHPGDNGMESIANRIIETLNM